MASSSFFFLLPEDIQRCVIQSWLLPEQASTSTLLKLWSTLDIACCNHGLRGFSLSPYLWQVHDCGHPAGSDGLHVKDLPGFCRWSCVRSPSVTLPHVVHLTHSALLDIHCAHAVAQLCPNMTTVKSTDGDFSEELLDAFDSLHWSINLTIASRPAGTTRLCSVIANCGELLRELRLPGPFKDLEFAVITDNCTDLRVVELTLFEGPSGGLFSKAVASVKSSFCMSLVATVGMCAILQNTRVASSASRSPNGENRLTSSSTTSRGY